MNAKFSPDKKYPTISIHASNQDDRFKLLEFTNTKLDNDVVPWIHSYGGEYNIKPGHDYISFGWLDKNKLKEKKDMTLNFSEPIGNAIDTLEKSYNDLEENQRKIMNELSKYEEILSEIKILNQRIKIIKKGRKDIRRAYIELTGNSLESDSELDD